MKKIYIAPQVKVYRVKPANIIATSVSLGDGSTDIMHSPGRDYLDEYLYEY